MPRIRSLKPDVWNDEALGGCSPLAILLFIGLITQADDEGRLRAHPARIRSAVLPFREDVTTAQVGAALDELAAAGVVILYAKGTERYAALTSWHRHQRIDRPSPSDLPAPPDSTKPRRATVEPSTQPRLPLDTEGKGEEKKGAEGKKEGAPDPDFDKFWRCYPIKKNKPGALKAWRQTARDRPPLPQLLAALKADVESKRHKPDWLAYFKHPATWLRARSWNDEVLVTKAHAHGFYTAPVPALLAESENPIEPKPDPFPTTPEGIERESWIDTFTSHGLPEAATEAETCSMERLRELQAIYGPHIESVRAAAMAKIRAGRFAA